MRDKNKGFRTDHLIVAVLLFAMAAIAFINVISRYFFHFSFAATEEITINIFVWMTVIGAGIAFERGAQMGMVTLFNIFPPVFRKGIIVFSAGLSAILFILVDYFMIRSVYDELTIFHATSGALGIPVWIYYIGVPIFSVFVFMGIYKDAVSRLEDNKGLPNK